MTPDMVMALATAGLETLTEYFKMLQTPEGQLLMEQMRKDRAAWDAFWAPVLGGLKPITDGLNSLVKP